MEEEAVASAEVEAMALDVAPVEVEVVALGVVMVVRDVDCKPCFLLVYGSVKLILLIK